MAPSDKISVGTIIESLVIEFDQEKYEEFLSSGSASPKSLWKYCKISTNLGSNEIWKATLQGTLPKDTQDLTSLKVGETSFYQAQGLGYVPPKTIGDLKEVDQNS